MGRFAAPGARIVPCRVAYCRFFSRLRSRRPNMHPPSNSAPRHNRTGAVKRRGLTPAAFFELAGGSIERIRRTRSRAPLRARALERVRDHDPDHHELVLAGVDRELGERQCLPRYEPAEVVLVGVVVVRLEEAAE